MKIFTGSKTKSKIDTIVYFSYSLKDNKSSATPKEVSSLVKSLNKKSFNGEMGQHTVFRNCESFGGKNIIIIGLGPSKEISAEKLRSAIGSCYGLFSREGFESVAFNMNNILKSKASLAQALVESLHFSNYSYDELKEKPKTPQFEIQNVELLYDSTTQKKSLDSSLKAGNIIGESVNLARRLGDTPGNLMTPQILANETTKAAKNSSLKVTIWNKERLKKEKMNCFLSVAQGSAQEPRLIMMQYNGAAKSKKPIYFVGKGVTFDTGGISLKPSAAMEDMKYDMCGAAAVIGAMNAIAKLKLKVNVVGLVGATENMPGSKATKPGDVHVARNGKSVEIYNTDAEGRLVLADVLAYASEQKPSCIVDAATLTGAMVIALGSTHTGFFTENNKMSKAIEQSSKNTGELMWQMPLHSDHKKDMKGVFADLKNIGGREAGSATAAGFLSYFVDEKVPWAHVDIAGTAWDANKRVSYHPKKGASGVMVRTFVEFTQQWKS